MFKFVVLSCLVSVAFAGILHAPVHYAAPAHYAVEKTIVEPHSTIIETPTVEHVATKVHSVPSATSYQSQTQYHSKTVAEPIYAHGVQKTIVNTPVVKEYIEQVPAVVPVAKVVAQPIVAKTVAYSAPIAYSAPAVQYSAPLAYSAYAPAHYSAHYPAAHSYAAQYALPAHASYAKYW